MNDCSRLPYHVCTQGEIDFAHELREHRDKVYRHNYFERREGDCPWVGDLGELVAHGWLDTLGIKHAWDLRGGNGPDIKLGNRAWTRVSVKTIKRIVRPPKHYEHGIMALQIDDPADYLFFCSYQMEERIMWLVGAISLDEFRKHNRFIGGGGRVHPGYILPDDHSGLLNVEYQFTTPPQEWLKEVWHANDL